MEFFNNLGSQISNFIGGGDYLSPDFGRGSQRGQIRTNAGNNRLRVRRQVNNMRVGQQMPAGTEMRGSGYTPNVRGNTPTAGRVAPSPSTTQASPVASPVNPQPTSNARIKPAQGPRPAPNAARTGGGGFNRNLGTAGAILSVIGIEGSEDPDIKWKRLGYSSKAEYDNAVAKAGGGTSPQEAFQFRVPTGRVVKSRTEEGAKILKSRSAEYATDVPGVDQEANRRRNNSNNGGGRNETRDIPGGGKQTGTNTGAVNMPGLQDVDMTGIANFAGPSFPTQPGTNKITAGYANTNSQFYVQDGNGINIADSPAKSQEYGIEVEAAKPLSGDNFRDMGANYSRFSVDNYKVGGRFTGPPTPTQGLDQTPGKSGPIDEDLEFGTSNPMGYALDGEEMRRRSAFLDASDSMSGMQNVAAGLGMGNQGIRNFANVNGEAVEMSQEERRNILNAAPGKAQALKDDFISRINSAKSEEQVAASSPAVLQNPDVNDDLNTGSNKNKINANAFKPGASPFSGMNNINPQKVNIR